MIVGRGSGLQRSMPKKRNVRDQPNQAHQHLRDQPGARPQNDGNAGQQQHAAVDKRTAPGDLGGRQSGQQRGRNRQTFHSRTTRTLTLGHGSSPTFRCGCAAGGTQLERATRRSEAKCVHRPNAGRAKATTVRPPGVTAMLVGLPLNRASRGSRQSILCTKHFPCKASFSPVRLEDCRSSSGLGDA